MIDILKQLRETTSTKVKEGILKNNSNNEDLKKILKFAYDHISYTYGVSSRSFL